MSAIVRFVVAVVVAGLLVGCSDERPDPVPGVPLGGGTNLQLLVGRKPAPLVLDVDSGAVRQIGGLPAGRFSSVEQAGRDAVVVSRSDCSRRDCGENPVFVLRRGSTSATRLLSAADTEPAYDGRGLWLLARGPDRCVLRWTSLAGGPQRTVRPLPCESVLIRDIPAGLLVTVTGGTVHSMLVKRDGTLVVLPGTYAEPAGGDLVLSSPDPGGPILLTDVRTGASHRLRWPSPLPGHVMGVVTPHPNGHLAAVAFYPARSGSGQTLDLWLLDLRTHAWTRLPDTPVHIGPDKPGLAWAPDGRLVLLAELRPGAAADAIVATWRPGRPHLTSRPVTLPGHHSTNFLPW